jgi:competence protein ComEC
MIAPRSSLGHRAPLLWLALPFATGLALGHATSTPCSLTFVSGVAILSFLLGAILSRQNQSAWALAFVTGTIALGVLYHELRRDRLPDWSNLPAREATLTVQIDRIFASPAHYTSRSFLGRILTAPAHLSDLKGQRLYLRLRGSPESHQLQRSSTVQVLGHLKPLPRQVNASDDFDAYLADAGINFSLVRGRVEKIVTPPTPYAQFRERIKTQGNRALSVGLELQPNLSGALRAMLLGERQHLDEKDKSLFVRTGTMHLFAISGLHIGVIAAALFGALRSIRLTRLTTFIMSTTLLAFYVDMIGRTPSSVRAWLMVTCIHAASLIRAPRNPVAAIAGSALLVLLIDPMQLFSAGFQMSYGIVFALLLYGLPLGEFLQDRFRLFRDLPEASLGKWQRRLRKRWEEILSFSALAWSATTVGLISGIAFFGWFTPIAFLANLLLIPAAGFAIIGGFIALVFGWLGLLPVALFFNHAASVVLLIIQACLSVAVEWTFLSRPAEFRWAGWGSTGLLLVLTAMVIGYAYRWETKVGRWWGPPLVSLVVLVIGTRFT